MPSSPLFEERQLRRNAALIVLAALWIPSAPAWSARIVDVRAGDHADYARVVFELDAPVDYRVEQIEIAGSPALRVTLEAGSSPFHVGIASELLGEITVDEADAGAIAEIRLRRPLGELRQRVFTDPPRIVLDIEAGSPTTSAPLPPVASDPRAAPQRSPSEAAAPPLAEVPVDPAPRIVDVRVGDHGEYTRVVLELDAPAVYRLERAEDGSALRLNIDATSPSRRVTPRGSLVAEVVTAQGIGSSVTELRLRGGAVAVKESVLRNPARIVLDLSPASQPVAVSPAPMPASTAASSLAAATPTATADLPAARPSDGQMYPISELKIVYIDPNPQFPSPEEMAQIEVELGRSADGLVAPRADLPVVRLRLSALPSMGGPQRIFGSAIRAIDQQLTFEFNRRDFYAIVVAPLPEEIESRRPHRDLRPPGETRLSLGVYAGRVKDIHSFASGERWEDRAQEQKLDLPEHAWILEGSPVRTESPDDLVRKDQIDDYVARLNRHPSRRVDAEIAPSRIEGGVSLDYLVTEAKPWWAYAQVENTGTEETTKMRERFGFVDSQLLGRDDTLQLDYITGNFDEVQVVLGSYEIPFTRDGRFHGRAFGAWSRYDASVLGFRDSFHAKQIDGGAQLIGNLYQWNDLFLDAVVGGQYERVNVENDLADSRHADDFALGMVALRAERVGTAAILNGEVAYWHNFAGIANTNADELELFGRLGVDQASFDLLRWSLDLDFFLEPLLIPRTWRDPSYWEFETKSFAHELFLSFNGQNAFNNRLIPQQEQVAGGFYTVRGYPQAAAVGDNVETFTAEYRLHIPRLFAPGGTPWRVPGIGRFRVRPQYEFSFPDWDLILRAFYDLGHVTQIDPDAFDLDQTLMGAGVGIELRTLRYLTARLDYGIALKKVVLDAEDTVHPGHDQVHFVVTILY